MGSESELGYFATPVAISTSEKLPSDDEQSQGCVKFAASLDGGLLFGGILEEDVLRSLGSEVILEKFGDRAGELVPRG